MIENIKCPRERKNTENRILVNAGRVTIMLNSRHPPNEKVEVMLKGLCFTISAVDARYNWDKLAQGMIELTDAHLRS